MTQNSETPTNIDEISAIFSKYSDSTERENALSNYFKRKELKEKLTSGYLNKTKKGIDRFRGKNGYWMIKVNGKWVAEHRHNWIQKNGELPRGWIVKFRDNDKDNTNESNLVATPKYLKVEGAKLSEKIIFLESNLKKVQPLITMVADTQIELESLKTELKEKIFGLTESKFILIGKATSFEERITLLEQRISTLENLMIDKMENK